MITLLYTVQTKINNALINTNELQIIISPYIYIYIYIDCWHIFDIRNRIDGHK